MSDSVTAPHPLGFGQKVRASAACAVGIALFAAAGWTVIRPDDPYAAITLLLQSRAWAPLLVGMVALAAVTSAVGTAIASGTVPHIGTLSAAAGLSILSFRGGTMTQVLMYHGAAPAERRVLAVLLLAEAVLWSAAIAAAWIVGQVTRRWLNGGAAASTMPAGADGFARLSNLLANVQDGLLGTITCAAIAALFISTTISRREPSPVQHGQVLFAVGAGFLIAALIAQRVWSRTSAGWLASAVLLTAAIGYGWGYMRPQSPINYYGSLATTPPNPLFRPLPIQYAGMGTAGVILGSWFGRRMLHGQAEEVG